VWEITVAVLLKKCWNKCSFGTQIQQAVSMRSGTVRQFLADLEPSVEHWPVWRDELYLELHRGCATSRPDQKRHNKTLERLLREADTASALLALTGQPSPSSDWRPLLFQQFHDILPGTSIPEVFDQAETLWRDARRKGKQQRDLSLARLLQVPNEEFVGAALVLVLTSTVGSLVAHASPPEGLLECGRPAAFLSRRRRWGALGCNCRFSAALLLCHSSTSRFSPSIHHPPSALC
jgi:hypothetical protein